MVDEYEDTTAAQRSILQKLATENPNHLYAEDARVCGGCGGTPDPQAGTVLVLDEEFRNPTVRFWKCSNERAQAQAVAREVEHLLSEGTSPARSAC